MSRACLSGDARCTGFAPCLPCYERFQEYVVPRAMFLAGPPFVEDPHLAGRFMGAFAQAWTEARAHVEAMMAETAPPEAPPSTTNVTPATFREALLVEVARLNPDEVRHFREKVRTEKLEGWQEYTEEEKEVLRQVLAIDATKSEEKKEEKKTEVRGKEEDNNGVVTTAPEMK